MSLEPELSDQLPVIVPALPLAPVVIFEPLNVAVASVLPTIPVNVGRYKATLLFE